MFACCKVTVTFYLVTLSRRDFTFTKAACLAALCVLICIQQFATTKLLPLLLFDSLDFVCRVHGVVKNFKLFYEGGQHFVGEKRFDR